MSDDRIEAEFNYKPRSVDTLFANSFFYIPKYQRGYAWKPDEQVNDLLVDLAEALTSYPDDFYLLGQIIVTSKKTSSKPTADEEFEVVDGQQRLSTLFLILLALKKKINIANLANRKDELRLEAITTRLVDLDNSGVPRTRIELSKDGQEIISLLLHELPENISKEILDSQITNSETSSQENLLRAWLHINEFLDKEYKSDIEKFMLLEFITTQVVLVRLKVRDSSQALNIFWKTNDRGLDLDDADLLKNLLFISVNESTYGTISNDWASASRTLHASRLKRVKSMIFLMKALIGIKVAKSIPQNSVYKEWKKLLDPKSARQSALENDLGEVSHNVGIDSREAEIDLTASQLALELSNSLPLKAESLRRISHSQSPREAESVLNLGHGSHSLKAIQHFQVLLAGDHLNKESYEELLKLVEDRVMLSLLASESTQDFERLIHPWSHKINGLAADATLADIQEASSVVLENVDSLFEIMKTTLAMLHYKRHYLKIRYVLSRTTRFCELVIAGEADGMVPSMSSLMNTSSDDQGFSLQIDHIFPKAAGRESEWRHRYDLWRSINVDSGEEIDRDYINSIGNLTLLHSKINLDQSDLLPDEKSVSYAGAQNKWLVNLALGSRLETEGATPQYSEAFNFIRSLAPVSLEYWNPADVINRESMMWTLLREDMRRTLKQASSE